MLGRQRERLVVAVRVERLRAAEHRREPLQRGAHEVVDRLLRREGRAAGLRVEAQHHRARVLRAEALLHDARPEPARGAELRDLLEEVAVAGEEERQAGAKSSILRPRSSAACVYWMALAIVKPTSCAAVSRPRACGSR